MVKQRKTLPVHIEEYHNDVSFVKINKDVLKQTLKIFSFQVYIITHQNQKNIFFKLR